MSYRAAVDHPHGHRSRRDRFLIPTTMPSGPKVTDVTDAPGRPSIRLNAVVTRT
ncbi:MAG: hypothetical protein ACJ77A_07875 [Actinomycetota bacterium]